MSWLKKNNVLVPIDFSDVSFSALAPALEFLNDPSHLHVIHVLPTLYAYDPVVVQYLGNDEDRKQQTTKLLEEKLDALGYKNVQTVVEVGDPSAKIVDYAKNQKLDLIVMPSHGRTGIGRYLLGSVAERVVRLAPCPVLILRQ